MGLEKSSSLDPLIEITEVESNTSPLSLQRLFKSSWRATVSVGALLAGAVLIVNVTALAWGTASSQQDGQTASTLFEGSCDTAQNATLWIHLAINVLSTLLLGASNNCAQLLSSPTRSEIDRAHLSGTWLEIGVPGLRNLPWINGWRRLVWLLLLATSFPLHLLYNSAIYGATAANAYQVALVTPDFLSGGWWDTSRAGKAIGLNDPSGWYAFSASPKSPVEPTKVMQNSVEQLVRLENEECIKIYTTQLQSSWGDVLVVTSINRNDSVIQVWDHNPAWNGFSELGYNDQHWVCTGRVDYQMWPSACSIDALMKNATHWTIRDVAQCQNMDGRDCTRFDAPVKYCLATRTPSHCSVRMSAPVMWVVIVCNLIKFACLLSTVYLRHFEPVATIGDAISSFVEQADSTTSHMGFLSNKNGGTECASRTYRWRSAAGSSRAMLIVFVFLSLWFAALILLFVGFVPLESQGQRDYKVPTWRKLSQLGLGTMNFSYTIGKGANRSLVENIMLANLPQLGVSLVYVLYNNAITYMVSAHEYAKFATTRSTLRVSRPRREQRTTFWLQLPYRYALPLLTSMAVLHWIVSRCLFMFQLTVYGDNGAKIVDRKAWTFESGNGRAHPSELACGYSPLAIIYALIVGAVLILALVAISFRKLTPGMPITASNSLAISAAASTAHDEPNAAFMPLKYGALQANWSRREVQRVGLSSKEVTPITYHEYEVIGKCVTLSDHEYWVT